MIIVLHQPPNLQFLTSEPRSKRIFLVRKPGFLTKRVQVLETAVGVIFVRTRFSLVRRSIRNLGQDFFLTESGGWGWVKRAIKCTNTKNVDSPKCSVFFVFFCSLVKDDLATPPAVMKQVRADFWEGNATKHFSVKRRDFQ